MDRTPPWWQTTTIYQIYPRSFADSNNNGIGDLRGIISKLDYIQDLGFETIWFSPFFCSPQQDYGYDISNYVEIAPEYGTLADADELIREIHTRGMRVIFDQVGYPADDCRVPAASLERKPLEKIMVMLPGGARETK